MSITAKDVLKVATLAEIDVPPTEVESLAKQLDGIVAYVDQIRELGAGGSDEAYLVGPEGLRLRDDHVAPIHLDRSVIEMAPETREGFILVPRLSAMEEG